MNYLVMMVVLTMACSMHVAQYNRNKLLPDRMAGKIPVGRNSAAAVVVLMSSIALDSMGKAKEIHESRELVAESSGNSA